jgi:hypothetical protein
LFLADPLGVPVIYNSKKKKRKKRERKEGRKKERNKERKRTPNL